VSQPKNVIGPSLTPQLGDWRRGVDPLLDTVFCLPVMKEGRSKAVIVENKSGRQAYLCRAVVDATGDVDVLARAGVPCAQQDNFLTYWSYCLTEDSLKHAVARQSVKNLLKLVFIGENTGKRIA
jgi:hypothetical protein